MKVCSSQSTGGMRRQRFFLTRQTNVASAHTINIRTAILNSYTQKLSTDRSLMTEKSEGPHKEPGCWAAPLNKTGLTLQPWNPSLSSLLSNLSQTVSLSPFSSPSICLSQLHPVHSWGMSHSHGVRISEAGLPCIPAHVLSLTSPVREREGEGERARAAVSSADRHCVFTSEWVLNTSETQSKRSEVNERKTRRDVKQLKMHY